MTHERYEIEFQGSNDGRPGSPIRSATSRRTSASAPGIYAPYQPRFDWNLWFASLSNWRSYPFVVQTEKQLLGNEPDVLALFAGNPFAGAPPKKVRAVIWRYWFTDRATKRKEGTWWRRELLGVYAPVLERTPEGRIVITE